MGPVIGLDVSKGASVFQAFVKRNEVLGTSETVGIRRLGSADLATSYNNLRNVPERNPLSFLKQPVIIIALSLRI
ncbi:hypothetical protein DFP95_12924 [Cohnella lupini]|uniref:Uncharacterized protein n=1 Tax=Cohnella lupini TaxID=1294267 RepID=A0A3D9HTQ2_9BACL|nr:hypothetical protein [Cohnella lupini]RED52892.1 hypothetical protein DFP95_12924 [Cohnella lupini]